MDSLQHTTRLRSIMEASADKLSLNIPRQNSGSGETFSPGIFVKRWTNYDTPSLGGSLGDLEGCSSSMLHRRDSYLNSLASTNDGSRFNLDAKTLTRNQSLESDGVATEDGCMRFSMSPEKPCSAQLFDYTGRDLDACSEILENSEEEAVNQSLDISRDLLEEVHESQSALEEPAVAEPVVQHVCPSFRIDGVNAKNSKEYTIAGDRTLTYKNNTRYSPLYADQALPNTGRCSFSVRIDHCNKTNAKLYIGIAESSLQGQPLGYKPGFYFVSAFSRESYLNGLKIVDTSLLPKEGDVVTVTVDMDLEWISFQSEKGIMAEGKINLRKGRTQEFYPCIALGENGGAVTFI